MAIDTGLALDCYGLVEVGGLQNIYVTDLANLTTVTALSTQSVAHEYTALTYGTWAMFQLKPNTASWSTTSSKENGITKYETTVQWYIPNITTVTSAVLENMKNKCIVAVGEFRSGVNLTCGISEVYGNSGFGVTDWIYNATYAVMTVEETSGSDFVDGNGATVTLVASSFETPRTYSGAITPAATNTVAALA
tara:strand:+ start:777 stop:1355 length:579 start_codon:yes stop_codon:yes gene_type:complete